MNQKYYTKTYKNFITSYLCVSYGSHDTAKIFLRTELAVSLF